VNINVLTTAGESFSFTLKNHVQNYDVAADLKAQDPVAYSKLQCIALD
jgi:hypothetical protein